eukprot:172492-Chlamydomonas_euryale.AAC.3
MPGAPGPGGGPPRPRPMPPSIIIAIAATPARTRHTRHMSAAVRMRGARPGGSPHAHCTGNTSQRVSTRSWLRPVHQWGIRMLGIGGEFGRAASWEKRWVGG